MTMNGKVHEATVENGQVSISDGWSINPPDTDATDRNGMPLSNDDDWRLGAIKPTPTTARRRFSQW